MTNKSSSSGFSVIEVLVAVSISAIVLTSTASAFIAQLRFTTRGETRTEAMLASQQVIDDLRASKISTLPPSGMMPGRYISIGARTYLVQIEICPVSDYCTSNNIRHFAVSTTYKGEKIYSTETVFAKL